MEYDRMIQRDVAIEDIKKTLRNPLKIGERKKDEDGRESIKAVGEKSTIYVNPANGKIITAHATSRKLVRRLRRKDENTTK